jgi:hypothetical protein
VQQWPSAAVAAPAPAHTAASLTRRRGHTRHRQ